MQDRAAEFTLESGSDARGDNAAAKNSTMDLVTEIQLPSPANAFTLQQLRRYGYYLLNEASKQREFGGSFQSVLRLAPTAEGSTFALARRDSTASTIGLDAQSSTIIDKLENAEPNRMRRSDAATLLAQQLLPSMAAAHSSHTQKEQAAAGTRCNMFRIRALRHFMMLLRCTATAPKPNAGRTSDAAVTTILLAATAAHLVACSKHVQPICRFWITSSSSVYAAG